MKRIHAIAVTFAIAGLVSLAPAVFAADATAPSELPQDTGHGPMSPSTGALRNPNDPDTKAAETRSRDKVVETGRGDNPGEGGSIDFETGEKKGPEAAEAERGKNPSLGGAQH